MKKILLVVFMSLCISAPAFALDGNEMLKKVDRNLNPESYEMYRKLMDIEPDGSKKEFVMYAVKKGKEKMASVFLSPASEKGRSTLRIGENMWLYIPNVGKCSTIRISCALITVRNTTVKRLKQQTKDISFILKQRQIPLPMTE